MIKFITASFFIVFILGTHLISAQRYSEDKSIFRNQVIGILKGIGTEVGNKVAYDFENAWDVHFTSEQQDKIHHIALVMNQKGYGFVSHFYYYFSYLAYAVAQENLKRDQLTQVININELSVNSLSSEEYKEFLFGLNIFFAGRYLSYGKKLTIISPEGFYKFALLDGFKEENRASPVSEIEEISESQAEETAFDWGDTENTTEEAGTEDAWDNSSSWDNDDDFWSNEDDGRGDILQEDFDNWQPSPSSAYLSDELQKLKEKFILPSIEGPTIDFKGTNIVMVTQKDTLRIKNVNSTFLLKKRNIVATQGVVLWPARHSRFKGATVHLKDFFLKKDRSDFKTPYASLECSSIFSGLVHGTFEHRGLKSNSISSSPIFLSQDSDINIKFSDRVSYTGGIQLKGNKLFGTSLSKAKGKLKITGNNGNSVVLTSTFFTLDTAIMSTEHAAVTIAHGQDTIYHKNVKAKYNFSENKLTILRNAGLTPYLSSFFGVSIGADMIEWDMNASLIFISRIDAKSLLPVTFKSNNYFNEIEYRKLGRFLHYHPIGAMVHAAATNNEKRINTLDFALKYQMDEKLAIAGAKILSEYDFANYDIKSGEVNLKDKAFHYYKASGKQIDFDNYMIPSIVQSGPNAIFFLDSMHIKIFGVDKFYLTTNFGIHVTPRDKTVTLLKNRNVTCNGSVLAGKFNYYGENHNFDYTEFFIDMPQIDSIILKVPEQDTTNTGADVELVIFDNQIKKTNGTLFINEKNNKSGKEQTDDYPNFVSESEALVYFDGEEILGGAYDKSVNFVIPPTKIDNEDLLSSNSIDFEGKFNSGGIFPVFEEILAVQPDGSLGFTHQMPVDGYSLYDTEAKTYDKIYLNSQGIRGKGQIDFLSTKVYSDDFIYYPDSVITLGTSGSIATGDWKGTSYPDVVWSTYKMNWYPKQGDMIVESLGSSFKFYNSTSELDGEINITLSGVKGTGTMFTKGAKTESKDIHFYENDLSARHANFQVLSDDPSKPFMEGIDVRLDIDVNYNIATLQPEKSGVASISFPYTQLKTSITKATWNLEQSIVTMEKPPNNPIEESYFYSTNPSRDFIAFYAERAIYNIQTEVMKIEGIPYLVVAGVKIIPENNELSILANSEIPPLKNAQFIVTDQNEYHHFDQGELTAIYRDRFEGSAFYRHIVDNDTFHIYFEKFIFDKKQNSKKTEEYSITVSGGGNVEEASPIIIASGFRYKGELGIQSTKKALNLDGYVQLIYYGNKNNTDWIQFKRNDETTDIVIDINNAVLESEKIASTGIHINSEEKLYTTFLSAKEKKKDHDFFLAKGNIKYADNHIYESKNASSSNGYEICKMIYNRDNDSVFFEGPVQFLSPDNTQLNILATGKGQTNVTQELLMNAMILFDFYPQRLVILKSAGKLMNMNLPRLIADDINDVVERMGLPTAADKKPNTLTKIANLIGNESTQRYVRTLRKKYTPLVNASKMLEKLVVISNIDMKRDNQLKAWYSTSKIGISNIGNQDVNATLNGFLEIKKDASGSSVVNLFIQASPSSWYYFAYSTDQLISFSSNSKFNEFTENNAAKLSSLELLVDLGQMSEVLDFIHRFRKDYWGINETYHLLTPEDVDLNNEDFDTIEEDDDFGF